MAQIFDEYGNLVTPGGLPKPNPYYEGVGARPRTDLPSVGLMPTQALPIGNTPELTTMGRPQLTDEEKAARSAWLDQQVQANPQFKAEADMIRQRDGLPMSVEQPKISNLSPKDYTPESWREYVKSGDTTKLVTPESVKAGKEDTSKSSKVRAQLGSLNRQWDLVEQTITKAKEITSEWSAGYGSMLKEVPKTDAYRLRTLLTTIAANIGFDKLQDMRANSPTGGALGQVSDRENILLQAVQGSLEQGLSPEELKGNLDVILKNLQALRQERNMAFEQDYGGGSIQKSSGKASKPGDVEDGYRWNGGPKGDPNSWERVQ